MIDIKTGYLLKLDDTGYMYLVSYDSYDDLVAYSPVTGSVRVVKSLLSRGHIEKVYGRAPYSHMDIMDGSYRAVLWERLKPTRRFEVGERVQIRTTDDMTQEYGLDRNGSINVPGKFTKNMGRCEWQPFVITSTRLSSDGKYQIVHGHETMYTVSADMLELVKVREMTVEEISKELGYTIKVVGGEK